MILEAAIPNVGQRYAFAQPTNQVSGQALINPSKLLNPS
jgi:hypothetical protein